jgi:crotonobetainyl-CoA:carnitine CoA-transferase CaiB-like acyl-CoA transferase
MFSSFSVIKSTRAGAGTGEKVMVSLYGQAIWDNAAIMQAEYHGNHWPKSRLTPDSPLRNTFKCKDGTWMMISVLSYERFYPAFCKVIGREDLIGDVRFSTEAAMRGNKPELMAILDPVFLTKDYAQWDTLLNEGDIAHDRINHIRDAIDDEQAVVNGYVYEYENRDGTKELLVSTPVKFGAPEPIAIQCAPLLGEHSVELMKELGYTDETISSWAAEGVVKVR